MLDDKLIKILAKVYLTANQTQWDKQKMVGSYTLPATIADKDHALLAQSHHKINQLTHYQHDEAVPQLKQIISQPNFKKLVFNLFIEAVGTGLHRGLQPMFSYLFANQMPNHSYSPIAENDQVYSDSSRPCAVCGLMHDEWRNDGPNLHDLYMGYCRIEPSFDVLLDLNEVKQFNLLKASQSSIAIFKQLIDFIEESDQSDTPTTLIDRLSKAKILPKSNHISRTWLIRLLAELGILKNKFDAEYGLLNKFTPYSQKLVWALQLHDEAPNVHSEVNFPISAWRGELGVNRKIADQILQSL